MTRTLRSGTRPPRLRPSLLLSALALVAGASACASSPAADNPEGSPGAPALRPDSLGSPVERARQPERIIRPLGPATATERIDTAAIRRIREEGMERSRVMEIASWLTDVHGPRLTNSPQHRAAADWAMRTMTGWGLANARLESFGPFGRGWTNERVSVHVVSPQQYPVIAYAAAWTPGTNGLVTGEAVRLPELLRRGDLEQVRGRLRGKFIMVSTVNPIPPVFTAPARRWTEEELAQLEAPAEPVVAPAAAGPGGPGGPGGFGGQGQQLTVAQIRAMVRTPAPNDTTPLTNAMRNEFLALEGIGALVTTNHARGNYGVFTTATGMAATRGTADATVLPQVNIAPEDYGRILRTLDRGLPVTLEVEVRNTFHDADSSFNVLAELPGTDRRDEIVMLGAHFDSWHTGTGATDNASGSAVMMEAMRILRATGVPLRRTVRIGLWGGEEQGLIGSRQHVSRHYGDRDGTRRPGHDRFSAYFNMDNGTGAFRGVYAQGNAAAVPVFREWIAPLRDLGITTVSMRNTGATDHLSFDAVGLPGFQFIQDPIEYITRTHHSNMDTFERLVDDDLKKNAVIVAAFAFIAANRDDLFPRKPIAATER